MCRRDRSCVQCGVMFMPAHPVDAPMAARTAGGLAGAALQKSALAASVAVASVAGPVWERLGSVPANWATVDFPALPFRLRSVFYAPSVRPGDDLGTTPTRTDRLNDMLGFSR